MCTSHYTRNTGTAGETEDGRLICSRSLHDVIARRVIFVMIAWASDHKRVLYRRAKTNQTIITAAEMIGEDSGRRSMHVLLC